MPVVAFIGIFVSGAIMVFTGWCAIWGIEFLAILGSPIVVLNIVALNYVLWQLLYKLDGYKIVIIKTGVILLLAQLGLTSMSLIPVV